LALSARRATKRYFVWELTGLAQRGLAQRPAREPRDGFRRRDREALMGLMGTLSFGRSLYEPEIRQHINIYIPLN